MLRCCNLDFLPVYCSRDYKLQIVYKTWYFSIISCTIAVGNAAQNHSDFGLRKFMKFHWKKVMIHELALQLSVTSWWPPNSMQDDLSDLYYLLLKFDQISSRQQKGLWTYADWKSVPGSKDYIAHGPCLSENFCIWLCNASKLNSMVAFY